MSFSQVFDDFSVPVDLLYLKAKFKGKQHIQGLTTILTELGRIRLHGINENETDQIKTVWLTRSTSIKGQVDKSTKFRDMLLKKFFKNEALQEDDNAYRKCVEEYLPCITATELSTFAEKLKTSCSCSIIATSRGHLPVLDLRNAVDCVNCLEEAGNIVPWVEEDTPCATIVSTLPKPGTITQNKFFDAAGVHELHLSNGMIISYKQIDSEVDQTTYRGFAYGGLSEVPEPQYYSCKLSFPLGSKIGLFGHKPRVFKSLVRERDASVGIVHDIYERMFFGECGSLVDLETSMQMVYQLFSSNKTCSREEFEEELETLLNTNARDRNMEKAVKAILCDFLYGNSFCREAKCEDIRAIDLKVACEYLNRCFKDPSAFHVLIVSNLEYEVALPLILQYLGGIERPSEPVFHYDPKMLKEVPVQFPSALRRDIFQVPLKGDCCRVDVIFPFTSKIESQVKDSYFLKCATGLLNSIFFNCLRHEQGKVYKLDVFQSYSRQKPSSTEDVRGEIIVMFACFPSDYDLLINLVVDEFVRLQNEGFTDEEVQCICQCQQKDDKENTFKTIWWLQFLSRYYQSFPTIDLDAAFLMEVASRHEGYADKSSMNSAIRRMFHLPCNSNYVVHILEPEEDSAEDSEAEAEAEAEAD
ncbi:hypothetical protein AQUCO_01400869v1 [Aquilegia coerulea]|nr:hypothetical protein AQUCO_01400869v1 [Aquilegia coerulea]